VILSVAKCVDEFNMGALFLYMKGHVTTKWGDPKKKAVPETGPLRVNISVCFVQFLIMWGYIQPMVIGESHYFG